MEWYRMIECIQLLAFTSFVHHTWEYEYRLFYFDMLEPVLLYLLQHYKAYPAYLVCFWWYDKNTSLSMHLWLTKKRALELYMFEKKLDYATIYCASLIITQYHPKCLNENWFKRLTSGSLQVVFDAVLHTRWSNRQKDSDDFFFTRVESRWISIVRSIIIRFVKIISSIRLEKLEDIVPYTPSSPPSLSIY